MLTGKSLNKAIKLNWIANKKLSIHTHTHTCRKDEGVIKGVSVSFIYLLDNLELLYDLIFKSTRYL
jgi:hypothetical protein